MSFYFRAFFMSVLTIFRGEGKKAFDEGKSVCQSGSRHYFASPWVCRDSLCSLVYFFLSSFSIWSGTVCTLSDAFWYILFRVCRCVVGFPWFCFFPPASNVVCCLVRQRKTPALIRRAVSWLCLVMAPRLLNEERRKPWGRETYFFLSCGVGWEKNEWYRNECGKQPSILAVQGSTFFGAPP